MVIVSLTLDVGYVTPASSPLSFIGLAAQPPSPERGDVDDGPEPLSERLPVHHLPGIALTRTVLAVNVLGDGLRGALDLRTRRR